MATYTNLISDLPLWMDNNSSEYAAALPSVIGMAESRIYRDLRETSLYTTVTSTTVAGDPYITTPSDLLQPRSLRLVIGGVVSVLEIKQVEFLYIYSPDDAQVGVPQYYAIDNFNRYRLSPVPAGAYTYVLDYEQIPAPLSDVNTTNWLTIYAYDLIFAAAMIESSKFILDDRQTSIMAMWEPRYQEALAAISKVNVRSERDNVRVPNVNIQND